MANRRRWRTSEDIQQRAKELRKRQTPAEQALWARLRGKQLGYKFRRQHPIDRYIVDFCCARHRLVIEVDGGAHRQAAQAEYDDSRTAFLEELGYTVIRFSNERVRWQIDRVLDAIVRTLDRLAGFSPSG